mmetsp:Transcript_35527/g.60420  ORF Transcript_35527/g.60420 Transcript_35527/m.60420 type:complete len:429 (-) Transcript_35527:712-1998(-)
MTTWKSMQLFFSVYTHILTELSALNLTTQRTARHYLKSVDYRTPTPRLKVFLKITNARRHIIPTPATALQLCQGTILPHGLRPTMLLLTFHQFLHEFINLEFRNVGHNYYVGNVLLAGKLPSFDEFVIHWTFEHNGGGKVVEAACEACFGEFVAEELGCLYAVYNIPLNTRQTLLPQRIPKVQCRLTIPTSHNRGIDRVQIIDPLLHLLHMLLPRNRNATGHGTPQHLVPAHGNGIDGLAKRHLRGPIHERHHHGKEGSIAMNVEPFAGDPERFENAQYAIEVVHRALDGGPDVDIDDHGTIAILGNLGLQCVVVDLAHGKSGDGLGVHAVIAGRLEDAVVRLAAGVEDSIGVTFAREEDAVEVALGAAGGDVAPVGVGGHFPEVGEEVDDGTLELTGVNAVVGGDEGIAEVVDGVLHEFVELLVVVH